jgi:hypothetical protein
MTKTQTILAFPHVCSWSLLGVAFIVLKLCGVIHWPWWLVTLPLWFGPALALVILIAALLFAVVCFCIARFIESAIN